MYLNADLRYAAHDPNNTHHMRRLLTLVILIVLSFSASAATFTVTSSADSGPGTFRQATIDALSTFEPDTILFATNVDLLSDIFIGTQIDINGDMSGTKAIIRGPGSGLGIHDFRWHQPGLADSITATATRLASGDTSEVSAPATFPPPEPILMILAAGVIIASLLRMT